VSLAFEERDRIWLCLWLYKAILACLVFCIVFSVVPARDVATHILRGGADFSLMMASTTTTTTTTKTERASEDRSGGDQQRVLEQECRDQQRLVDLLREERDALRSQLQEETAAACEAQKHHDTLWHAARRTEERAKAAEARAKAAEARARELTAKCHDLDASSAAARATLERVLEEARRRLEARPSNDIGLALGRLDVAQLPASTLAQVEAALPCLQLAITREVLKREMDLHQPSPSNNAGPSGECIVCLAAPRSVAFDCGHLCVCSNCAYNVDACPICREPVTERRRIFRS